MVVGEAGEWVGTDDTPYLGQAEFAVLVGTSSGLGIVHQIQGSWFSSV